MKKYGFILLLLFVVTSAHATGTHVHTQSGGGGTGVVSGCLEFASGDGGNGEYICNTTNGQVDIKDDDGTVYGSFSASGITAGGANERVKGATTGEYIDFATNEAVSIRDEDGTAYATFKKNVVGFGTESPADEFDVKFDQNGVTAIRIENLNAGNGASSVLRLVADEGSGIFQVNSAANSTRPDAFVLSAASTLSGGMYLTTTAAAPITFQTNGANTRATLTSGGALSISATNTTPASLFIVDPPSAQTIAAGNTITADSCGTLKLITAAGGVTTDTTNTFTAPAAANEGCCMDVLNVGANAITLDNNALTLTNGAADVVLGANDSAKFCSTGASGAWYQIGATGNN